MATFGKFLHIYLAQMGGKRINIELKQKIRLDCPVYAIDRIHTVIIRSNF